ncbi:MAG TPA: cytochrome c-type biogenesis protein, partial [Myxococcaceae bacterium]|nr:cytochrome c-type biogenesis protein [Myxococcaceae bacterium]
MIGASLAALLLTSYVPQEAGSAPLADPALEARVHRLGKQLRCAVCQGMSIADSPAQMARAQLDTVRKLVAEGKTDDEILDWFVQRYDEWVLLEPRRHGFALFVWLGPALAVMGGLVFVMFFIRGRNKRPPGPPGGATVAPPAGAADDEYL